MNAMLGLELIACSTRWLMGKIRTQEGTASAHLVLARHLSDNDMFPLPLSKGTPSFAHDCHNIRLQP
jgi:hypothetical protein